MDVISTYAVESTVWWDYGPDAKPETKVVPQPGDGSGSKGGADRDKTDKDKEKNKDSDEAPKPAPKPSPKAMVGPKAEPGDLLQLEHPK
jgi:hypothetical protein